MKNGANQTQRGQNVPNLSEDAARDYFERLRWPNGPVCPHCGSMDTYRMGGEATRPGLLKCRDCSGQFSVTVNTIMEDSHLPLATWVKAFHYMTSSKKGMSALQLQRNLGLGSYRTAWHLAHRIRYAMKDDQAVGMLKGQVQVDETYVGGKPRMGQSPKPKAPVVTLVETNGKVRSKPIENVDAKTLRAALDECCDPSAQIVTDQHVSYPLAANNFTGGHETVNHSKGEYARKMVSADGKRIETITTNTAEAYFSLLKRGVYGTFHHVSKQHLHRYCSEFDFRWNGRDLMDAARRDKAVQQIEGKRLFYRQPVGVS